MRSDICVKCVAIAQVGLYDSLNSLGRSYPTVAKTSAVFVSAADVLLDTLKHPGTALESSCMCLLNLVRAPCSNQYSVKDAKINLKLAAIASLTTFAAIGISIPKFVIQTHRAIANPSIIHSYNADAEKEAKFMFLVV